MRGTILSEVRARLRDNPVVALLGPRQVGKTTVAAQLRAETRNVHYFDLENPQHAVALREPMLALESLRGLVVIDEVQRRPEIFEVLRVLADRKPLRARFLLLGSASLTFVKGVSESLAGRVAFIALSGFSLPEVGVTKVDRLWWRGGFPRSFLARNDLSSRRWREDFVATFLERDLPALGLSVPAVTLRRFWTMVAHYHGQVWNAAEFARALGSAEATARRYLDILTSTFVVRQLPPWHENLAKRQVKAPKIYVRDTGLLHTLLGLETRRALDVHPKVGASWEGFVVEQVATHVKRDLYFWATHGGAELDLMYERNGQRIGIEVKYSDAPTLTKSMHSALTDLRLHRLYVIYPGRESYALHAKVQVVPARLLPEL